MRNKVGWPIATILAPFIVAGIILNEVLDFVGWEGVLLGVAFMAFNVALVWLFVQIFRGKV